MNLTQLQASIQAKGYGTDTAAAQLDMLNSAYREVLGKRRWPFLEKQDATIPTVVGTASYSLAGITDFLHVDAVRLEITATKDFPEIDYLPPQEFRSLEHTDRDNGTPAYWTFVNQVLRIYPAPDKVWTLRIDYAKRPPDLSAGGDIPVLPDAYHDILVWGAVRELTFRERDWNANQRADAYYQTRVVEMMSELGVRQRQSTRQVIQTGLYDANYGPRY